MRAVKLRWTHILEPADRTRLPCPILKIRRSFNPHLHLATDDTSEPKSADDGKDPAAVALGRKCGLKGGKARAESMTAKRRVEIEKRAAKTRWAKK